MKTLPFAIDRTLNTSLIDQIARGLRKTLASGAYVPGSQLPSIVEMAVQVFASTGLSSSGGIRLPFPAISVFSAGFKRGVC